MQYGFLPPFLQPQVLFTTNEPQSYVFGGRNHPLHSTSQQSILEKFAKENGFKHTRFFIDDGYSGVTFTRPAFMELMDLAEQGKIGTLIVKDHSRLGRNRLVVGQLLEEDFDRLDVRYIAIMDNIDTDKGLIDLVPMQDLFNEWHAKNTSQKVRNVFRSKGMSGIPLTTNPPFGYMKNPENPKEWLVDEPAAKGGASDICYVRGRFRTDADSKEAESRRGNDTDRILEQYRQELQQTARQTV